MPAKARLAKTVFKRINHLLTQRTLPLAQQICLRRPGRLARLARLRARFRRCLQLFGLRQILALNALQVCT
eukprot:7308211-Alexandrium_andersonii.AAC.1